MSVWVLLLLLVVPVAGWAQGDDSRIVLTRTPSIDDDWLTMQAFAEKLRPHLGLDNAGSPSGCVRGFVEVNGEHESSSERFVAHVAVSRITKVAATRGWTRVTVESAAGGRKNLLHHGPLGAFLRSMRC